MSDDESADGAPLDDLAERLGLDDGGGDEETASARESDEERDVPVDPPDGTDDGADPRNETGVNVGVGTDTSDDDAPLGDIARRVRERRERKAGGKRGDSGEAADIEEFDDLDDLADLDEIEGAEGVDEESLFESMSVGEVDSESVWEELVETDDATGRYPGVGGPAERVGVSDEYVVEKATFCKRCPFLEEPPKLSCENEGTEILEVVDSEHFRVRGCPMVDESDPTIGEF